MAAIGLTFDDVLLLPQYSQIRRDEIDLTTVLAKNVILPLPLISAPMDTVTEGNLALALGRMGGLGIIHRNLPVEKQASEVQKVKKAKVLVGAAVGPGKDLDKRLNALVKA